MAKTILILGCGVMQIPALRIAREMGWFVAAADGDPDADGRKLCDRFVHVDLKDTAGLIIAAGKIRKERGLDGIFTAGTDFSHSVAVVADALELPGHSPDAALLATDKVLMRRRFRDAGVSSPPFVEIGPADDVLKMAGDIPGPWVVKPVDSMGARGVIRIDSREELTGALNNARTFSRSGRALVESFMEGPEYSLDALVEDGTLIRCGLADRHIVYPPCFIEVGHTIPSSLPPKTADIIWDVFETGVKSLGLSRGAAKGDVKMTPGGPMIGEIAARLSGGYMSGWTWPYASGVEPTRGGLRLAVGLNAEIPSESRNLVCAERALIGIDGTVRDISGKDFALSLPGVKEVFLRYDTGDRLSFPRNNVEKVGNVIATGADGNEAEGRALSALQALKLELDPSDIATGEYLDAVTSFPPDAIGLSEDGDGDFHGYINRLWGSCSPRPSRGCSMEIPIIPIPPACAVHDYTGRSIVDILKILVKENLIMLGESPGRGETAEIDPATHSDFWKALIRGGLPGVRWYLEKKV